MCFGTGSSERVQHLYKQNNNRFYLVGKHPYLARTPPVYHTASYYRPSVLFMHPAFNRHILLTFMAHSVCLSQYPVFVMFDLLEDALERELQAAVSTAVTGLVATPRTAMADMHEGRQRLGTVTIGSECPANPDQDLFDTLIARAHCKHPAQ
jgi:hypothetical protein